MVKTDSCTEGVARIHLQGQKGSRDPQLRSLKDGDISIHYPEAPKNSPDVQGFHCVLNIDYTTTHNHRRHKGAFVTPLGHHGLNQHGDSLLLFGSLSPNVNPYKSQLQFASSLYWEPS